jgi:hypothetical protein
LKARHRLLGSIDDRLVLVEARVQQNADAGAPAKLLDQLVVQGILVTRDRLEAAGAVHVGYGRQSFARLRPDLHHVHHERALDVLLEVAPHQLPEDRRSEGPERLAPLDLHVDQVLHVRSVGFARIERFPRARGPHSLLPWYQPTTLPATRSSVIAGTKRPSS